MANPTSAVIDPETMNMSSHHRAAPPETPSRPPPDDVDQLRSLWGLRLDYLPVSLFASVMGLMGLSIAWSLAHERFGAPRWISRWIGYLALAAFLANGIGYLVKLVRTPEAVFAEFRHPIAGNLFGTVFISLLLLPFAFAQINLWLARGVWTIGAAGMVCFAWLIVSRWMSDRQQLAHATPAWIVPVVGLLDVPLAIPTLGLDGLSGVATAGVAVGAFFAVPLFTLIFSRLVFEAPMPGALQPSLMILLAPLSVGFAAYFAVVGRVDLLAEGLYAVMLFLLAVLLPRLRRLAQACPFRVSWWTVSFPLATSAAAATRFAIARPYLVSDAIAVGLLALATAVISWLTLRTVFGLMRGELKTLAG